jgi:hypothetical protein
MPRDRASGPVPRLHGGAGARPVHRRRGGRQRRAVRSRGGFSGRIHLKTDPDGRPLALPHAGGEARGSIQSETSLHSTASGDAARARGITPVIPRCENSSHGGRFFPTRLGKLRARIGQAIGGVKRFKRAAMRCDKTAVGCSTVSRPAVIGSARGPILVKSAHGAEGKHPFAPICRAFDPTPPPP